MIKYLTIVLILFLSSVSQGSTQERLKTLRGMIDDNSISQLYGFKSRGLTQTGHNHQIYITKSGLDFVIVTSAYPQVLEIIISFLPEGSTALVEHLIVDEQGNGLVDHVNATERDPQVHDLVGDFVVGGGYEKLLEVILSDRDLTAK